MTLEGLLRIAESREKGPATTFERAHLLFAFINIGDNRTIGRGALAVQSGLGEGAVRTIIKKLRKDGFVETNASGCFLTPGGRRVYDSIWKKLSHIAVIRSSNLGMGGIQAAVAVRGNMKAVRYGIEQRDSAIRVGAAGAITYIIKTGKIAIPGGSADCEEDYPDEAWSELREELDPRNGDAVILCGAQQETTAKLGALSAALTIM